MYLAWAHEQDPHPGHSRAGVVTRGALGVEIQPVTPEIANALNLKRIEGALVAEVQPDSPAAKGGILSGDVVVTLDGQAISDGADLAARIGAMAPGTAAEIGFLRNGDEHTVSVTLGELPVTPFKPATAPKQQEPAGLGLVLAPAAAISGAGSQGVAITGVDPNGLAAEKGFGRGRHHSRRLEQSGPYTGRRPQRDQSSAR